MSIPDSVAGVLISIKPEFATAIAEGRKTVELRRRFPLVAPGVWLVIYATQPVGAIIGMARIKRVAAGEVATIWRNHKNAAALDLSRFRAYFASRKQAYAVVLGSFEPIRPVTLDRLEQVLPGVRAPQSWRYLDRDTVDILKGIGSEGIGSEGIGAGHSLSEADSRRVNLPFEGGE